MSIDCTVHIRLLSMEPSPSEYISQGRLPSRILDCWSQLHHAFEWTLRSTLHRKRPPTSPLYNPPSQTSQWRATRSKILYGEVVEYPSKLRARRDGACLDEMPLHGYSYVLYVVEFTVRVTKLQRLSQLSRHHVQPCKAQTGAILFQPLSKAPHVCSCIQKSICPALHPY